MRFNPSSINRKNAPVVTATIQDDGTCELTTLVDENQVSLAGEGVANVPSLAHLYPNNRRSARRKPGRYFPALSRRLDLP